MTRAAIAALALAACGDDGGAAAPDATACAAAPSYDAFVSATAASESPTGGPTPDLIELEAELAGGDVAVIQLYKGFGAFAAGEIAPGTYPIAGDETQYATCGVCVLVVPLEDADAPYLAQAGAVTITSITPNLAGSVADVALVHVELDDEQVSTPAEDGCATAITAATFDAVVVPR